MLYESSPHTLEEQKKGASFECFASPDRASFVDMAEGQHMEITVLFIGLEVPEEGGKLRPCPRLHPRS